MRRLKLSPNPSPYPSHSQVPSLVYFIQTVFYTRITDLQAGARIFVPPARGFRRRKSADPPPGTGAIEDIFRLPMLLLGIEGGHAIEDSLRLLRRYYDEGVRYMTLTHTNSNHRADSSGDPNQPSNGLSPFGKQVVAEMNRLGMIVDISHVSDKTFWDALETSKAPIFASHSSCRAISPVPRNMTGEMIQALAKKGGVIQINFSCDFLNPEVAKADEATAGTRRALFEQLSQKYADDPAGMSKAFAEVRAAYHGPRATLADVVKHIDHVVAIAGIGAVGLGSDFDGIGCAPEGLDSVDKWPNLTRALLEEGYTAGEIRKIYGENTLRLMSEVERVSRSMR